MVAAAGELSSCTKLSAAQRVFSQSVTERQGLIRQVEKMTLTTLPQGATVKRDFVQFLNSSIADDRALATWTNDKLTGGCSQPAPGNTSVLNNAATAEKAAFIAVWNPVAAKYHLAQLSSQSI